MKQNKVVEMEQFLIAIHSLKILLFIFFFFKYFEHGECQKKN